MFDTVTAPAKQVLNATATTITESLGMVETAATTLNTYATVGLAHAEEFKAVHASKSQSRVEVAEARADARKQTKLADIAEETLQAELRIAKLRAKRERQLAAIS